MINNVVLVGRLTKHPELKYTSSGVAYCSFTLAVNRPYKSNDGEDADFISCKVWRKTAENLADFTKKGSLIGVLGSIQTSNFTNNEGQKIYRTDVNVASVQFLEPKSKDTAQQSNKGYEDMAPPEKRETVTYEPVDASVFENDDGSIDISDDDLPF